MCSKDRISDLPTDVRKYILSFLPTREAIRTSILSKTWRYDWLGLSFLDLVGIYFWNRSSYRMACKNFPDHKEAHKFLDFVHKAIVSKHHTIQKLQLYVPPIPNMNSRIALCLDGLILNELEVEVIGASEYTKHSRSCNVPISALSSNFMTKLYIQECNLTGISVNDINLPSLRELSINCVRLDQHMIESLIARCTSVEKLSFTYCQGFRSLLISGLPRLNYLEQRFNADLEVFEISEESLRTLAHAPASRCRLSFSNSCHNLTQLELLGCRLYDEFYIRAHQNLVVLKLRKCGLRDDYLDQVISQLSYLQVLEIAFCSGTRDLKITSKCLRTLTIRCDKELEHAEINCSNLADFSFFTKGCIISLSSKTILAPASVTLELSVNGTGDTKWDVKLVEFLKQLRLSKYLIIETVIIENAIIPARLRKKYPSPLSQFEQVTVFPQGRLSCLDVTRTIESFLWLCPQLATLGIMDARLGPNPRSFSYRFPKTLLKMLLTLTYKNETELSQTVCGCNPSLTVNCWRHSLMDFEIIEQRGFEDNDGMLRKFLERKL